MNDASVWSPVSYDLRNPTDAARFGLIWREAEVIRAKCIPAREGQRIEAIGLHIQWGHTAGSLRHWLGVAASATVMVQQDGSILRVIPEEHGPWTQGDVRQPDARASALLQRFGPDPNVYSLTIEAEDARTERINPAQERAICWQIRQWQRTYPQLAEATGRSGSSVTTRSTAPRRRAVAATGTPSWPACVKNPLPRHQAHAPRANFLACPPGSRLPPCAPPSPSPIRLGR